MKSASRVNGKNILVGVISLIIMGLCLFNTQNATVPFILNDEYGYWSNATWLMGYDWSSTVNEISWYSFGYSFILAIIIFLVKDLLLAYKVAILLNCILLVLSYVFLYVISFRFINKYNEWYAIVPVMYCSNWVNKNYAWPEILLFFLFILVTFMMIKIYETQAVKWYVLLGTCLIFMYMVHMRTISIIIASCIFLFFTSYKKKNAYIYFLLIMGLGIILQIILKKYFVTNLWLSSTASNSNGYASVIPSSISEITIDLFGSIISSFIGKLFYIVVTTMGAVVFMLQKLVSIRKRGIKERELRRDIIIYLMLCFVLSIGVSSVFQRNPQYTTHVLYGRYIEYIVAPIILISTILFFEEKESCKKFFCNGTMVVCISGLVVANAIEKTQLAQVNIPINSVGLSVFYLNGKIDLYSVILIYSLLNYIFMIVKEKYSKYSCTILIFIALIWFGIGQHAYKGQEAWSNNIISKKELARLCVEIAEEPEKEIYVYRGSSYWKSHACAEIIQFYYPNKKISYVNLEDLEYINEGIVFCITEDYSNSIQEKLDKHSIKMYLVDK